MKKIKSILESKVFAVVLCLVLIGIIAYYATGCNMQMIDTTWNFDYAYISLPNGGVIEGPVESWKDFDNSDCVQVKIKGETFLTYYSNVVLIQDNKRRK